MKVVIRDCLIRAAPALVSLGVFAAALAVLPVRASRGHVG